jgi:hypothetical protein
MKTTKILYWVFNILFFILMFGSAIPDLLQMADAVNGIHNNLGYPLYFVPFLGFAKMLGALTIIIPGHPRLKEWAYAGLFFDLIAATYSIYCTPHPQAPWYFNLIPLAVAVAAYVYYRKKEALNTEKPVVAV